MMRLLLALFVSLGLTSHGQSATVPKGFETFQEPPVAPNVRFLDASGATVTLSSFKGRLVVVNVWATWCAPCVKEIPSLESLMERLNSRRAVLVAISQDKGGASVAQHFLDRLGSKLPVFSDSAGRVSRELGIRGLPTTFVITSDGTIAARVEGPLEWDSEEVVNYISALDH